MKKLMIAILVGVALFQSCDSNHEITVTNDYLPLAIGNYWKINSEYDEASSTMEITGMKFIDGKVYYSIDDRYRSDTYTGYYRIENDKVYTIEGSSHESLKFILTAKVNDTWKHLPEDGREYLVTLKSKTETITINNQSIKNCLKFDFDIPAMRDDEFSVWLAPGIGFVQSHGSCCPSPAQLREAKIGSQVLSF